MRRFSTVFERFGRAAGRRYVAADDSSACRVNRRPHRRLHRLERLEERTLLSVVGLADEAESYRWAADEEPDNPALVSELETPPAFEVSQSESVTPEVTRTTGAAPTVAEIVSQVDVASYTSIHQDLLYTHLGDNRGPSGPEHDPARDNILTYFQGLGLDANLDPFVHLGYEGENVVGVKTSSVHANDVYIVGAHYDSVNNPGADDNASGVAAVMEAARVLAPYEFDSTLVFIAFDQEETGLHGSYAYVDEHAGDNILGMLNLDMVAYNPAGVNENMVRLYDAVSGGSIKTDLADAFALYGGGITAVDSGLLNRSDHAPFEFAGFDAALVIEHEVWNNPHYHKSTDAVETPGYIDYGFAANVTAASVGYLATAAGISTGEIRGSKFHDLDADGHWDQPEEPGLEGWHIYVDADEDGELDQGEPDAWTDPDGRYAIGGLAPGIHTVAEELQPGWRRTFPTGGTVVPGTHTVEVPAGQVIAEINFGNHVFDFGDAPDPTYPTLLANNGASHGIVAGFYLGAGVDGEADGQPTLAADGDDADGNDDEDGVVFVDPLLLGQAAAVEVTASAAGVLDAWIDFNNDGDWADLGEQVFTRESLTAGVNTLWVDVPADAAVAMGTYARFRFSSAGGLSYDGPAADGEVEDYQVAVTWFGPPEALNTNAGSDSTADSSPQVTTDGAGNWVAVWISADTLGGTIGTDADIFVSRSADAGGTWTTPAPLNTNAGSDSGTDYGPQVTTDGAGNWVAVWISTDTLGGTIGTDEDILVSRSADAGGTWTAPAPLNTNAGSDSGKDDCAQVTTDALGNWVAVWHSRDSLGGTIGTDSDILVSRSADAGVTWTAPAPLNANAGSDSGWDGWDLHPQVTTDGVGNWVAVWESNTTLGGTIGADNDILVSRSTNAGGTWTAPAPLNTNAASDSGPDWYPQVTTDGAGNWVAGWYSHDSLGRTIGTDDDILVSRSADAGGTWTDPAPLNTNAGSDSGNDRYLQVTTDGAGNWVAVWFSTDSLSGTIGTDNDILFATAFDDRVHIYGTAGDDVIEFDTDGTTHTIKVGATTYVVDHSTDVHIYGQGGHDSIRLYLSAGNEKTYLDMGTVYVDGRPSYEVQADSVETIRVYAGGGNDEAYLTGSDGDDAFYGYQFRSYLHGTGFFNYAWGFDYVEASATSGGATSLDQAWLFDSPGDDTFRADPTAARMDRGTTGTDDAVAIGFDVTRAYASGGAEHDEAYLTGSAGDDRFESYETYSYLKDADGTAFCNVLRQFDYVEASAAGQTTVDRAYLYDSRGGDVFHGDEGNSQMDRGKTGTDDVKALGFEVVKAHSSGGIDEAYLAGSSADDRFFSYLTYSYMQGGTGFYSFAIGFDYVQADVGGTGADFDRGYLYDSSRNDLFTGHTTYGEMISVGRWVKANDFDIGWAVSGAGDHDTATMWSGTLWRLAGDWENVIPHSPPGGAGLPGVDLDFARWLAALEHAKTTSNGDGESGEVNLAGLDYLFKLLGSR